MDSKSTTSFRGFTSAESSSSFDLINERGETILSVDTDSRGDYALPAAIHTGLYTLRMTKASLAIESWRDKIINIERYTGADSVTKVNASYYYVPPTMAPTCAAASNNLAVLKRMTCR